MFDYCCWQSQVLFVFLAKRRFFMHTGGVNANLNIRSSCLRKCKPKHQVILFTESRITHFRVRALFKHIGNELSKQVWNLVKFIPRNRGSQQIHAFRLLIFLHADILVLQFSSHPCRFQRLSIPLPWFAMKWQAAKFRAASLACVRRFPGLPDPNPRQPLTGAAGGPGRWQLRPDRQTHTQAEWQTDKSKR